jgi:hypothetical protein
MARAGCFRPSLLLSDFREVSLRPVVKQQVLRNVARSDSLDPRRASSTAGKLDMATFSAGEGVEYLGRPRLVQRELGHSVVNVWC